MSFSWAVTAHRTLWKGLLGLSVWAQLAFLAHAETKPGLSLSVREVSTLPGVYAGQLAFAPDGKTWAAGQQREISLFDGDKPIRTLTPVWVDSDADLHFLADGKKLAAGGRIYSLPDGKELFAVSANRAVHERGFEIDAATISPDFAKCVAWVKYHPSRCCREEGHRDAPAHKPASPVFVIDTQSGQTQPLPIEDGGFGEYRALAASSRYFVVGGVANKATVFDRKTAKPAATLSEDGAFYAFRFSADEKTLAAIHLGRFLIVYDGETFTKRTKIEVLPDGKWLTALAVSPSLPIVAVSGWDGNLRLYSLASSDVGKLLWSGPLGQASAIAFSPQGNELLVAVSNPNRIVRLAVSVVAGDGKPDRSLGHR